MSTEYLYGRRPILETLRANRRTIRRLIISHQLAKKPDDFVQEAMSLADQVGAEVEMAESQWLDSRARDANHQGVVLEAGAYRYAETDDILDLSKERGEPPFLLLLDLLQDVQNVGTLLRTAEAVGVHGVILQERRSAKITPAVVSASSGAVEHLHVAQVTNLTTTMKDLKDADVWFAGLDTGEDAQRYDKANLKGGIGLVVGSEGSGLRRLVRETCDFIIALPMRGHVESLNAATAGSIALYAAWQARDFT